MAVVYDFSVKNRSGEEVSLKDYEGKVILVVNTATGCGFTPHYEPLEAMYKDLKDKGLEILDFPCNQFADQAPGSDKAYIKWNFTKFLIDRNGNVIARFEPTVEMEEVRKAVEAELEK